MLSEHTGLSGSKYTVEPSKHGHGQHDALVLRRAVGTAQQIGDLPDQVGEVAVVRHEYAHSRRLVGIKHNIGSRSSGFRASRHSHYLSTVAGLRFAP